ncbi:hypothetical protein NQ315_007249 [Exocentrus adspersus]|uniref:ATP synthase subunit b n=1 Tax=Exocentrus adspersus TaxID=1586481 RepID=A0AAV8WCW1_9CUCU|nr:hypothetical protein NQ315_007249 [Exocentrus adspersus]
MLLNAIKRLHYINITCKSVKNDTVLVPKALYCDKKKILADALDKLTKEESENSIPVNKVFKNKTSEEIIETVAFANEEEISKTVTTEKEKDVKVRTRLSKECNILLDKRISFSSPGFTLHLDENATKNTCWENYKFDKTIDDLPKVNVKAVKGICEKTTQSKSGSGIKKDDKPPSSTNRIIRQQPGKVLFAFIPEEWFKSFIPKTGVTGFGTFLFTFGTYLVSKEYYVMEHNFYNGLGMFFLVWGVIKYMGPDVAKYFDREVDAYEKGWEKGRDETKAMLEEQIEDEKELQYQADGQVLLLEAKRENVHLQLEEAFRLRQMHVYKTVLDRLNYHVRVADVHSKIFHRNLIEYVTREVRKAITPELEKQMINISIDSLITELVKDKGPSGTGGKS